MPYQIKYVQQLPSGICPECSINPLKPSKFGKDAVYCSRCKIAWKISSSQPKKILNLATKADIEEIKKEIRFLAEQVNFFKDLTKQLIETLKRFENEDRVVFYPPTKEEKDYEEIFGDKPKEPPEDLK